MKAVKKDSVKKTDKKPAKKDTTTSAKKVDKKSAKKDSNKVVDNTKVADSAVHNNQSNNHGADQPVRSAVVLLFTKCNGTNVLLIGKETYEKWGPPGGGLMDEKEDPDKAAEREFTEEVGHPLPTIKDSKSFRYRNAHVRMMYTDQCIDTKIGPKAKTPHELLALAHIPVKDLYKLLASPKEDMPLRPIFISMMIDNKKVIEQFIEKMK